MKPEQLAALTEKERHDLRYGCEGTSHGNCELTEAHLTALADARLELGTWKQEFTRVMDDDDFYVQDALEAGQELADSEALVRMLAQDLAAAQAEVTRLKAERDRQREDIGRLVEALREWHHPHPSSCSLCLFLAEM